MLTFSQSKEIIWNHPSVYYKSDKSLAISNYNGMIRVDLDYFSNTINSWVRFDKNTYLKNKDGKKAFLIKAEGVKITPRKNYYISERNS